MLMSYFRTLSLQPMTCAHPVCFYPHPPNYINLESPQKKLISLTANSPGLSSSLYLLTGHLNFCLSSLLPLPSWTHIGQWSPKVGSITASVQSGAQIHNPAFKIFAVCQQSKTVIRHSKYSCGFTFKNLFLRDSRLLKVAGYAPEDSVDKKDGCRQGI